MRVIIFQRCGSASDPTIVDGWSAIGSYLSFPSSLMAIGLDIRRPAKEDFMSVFLCFTKPPRMPFQPSFPSHRRHKRMRELRGDWREPSGTRVQRCITLNSHGGLKRRRSRNQLINSGNSRTSNCGSSPPARPAANPYTNAQKIVSEGGVRPQWEEA